MRKVFLVLSLMIFSLDANAACTATPECAGLGYTKTATDCPQGGVKCPYGNSYFCENKACAIGDIYYSDKTCSANVVSGKTALGVVVYVKDGGRHGQVMSAWPVDKNGNKSTAIVGMYWSTETEYVDISSLPTYITRETAMTDFNSCSNTDKIVALGNASTYPAAWAARKHAPTTETKGKWCLPAAGIMTSIYNNQSAIQAGITKLGGLAYPMCCTWSSSESAGGWVWVLYLSFSYGLYDYGKSRYYLDVRPVLEF